MAFSVQLIWAWLFVFDMAKSILSLQHWLWRLPLCGPAVLPEALVAVLLYLMHSPLCFENFCCFMVVRGWLSARWQAGREGKVLPLQEGMTVCLRAVEFPHTRREAGNTSSSTCRSPGLL